MGGGVHAMLHIHALPTRLKRFAACCADDYGAGLLGQWVQSQRRRLSAHTKPAHGLVVDTLKGTIVVGMHSQLKVGQRIHHHLPPQKPQASKNVEWHLGRQQGVLQGLRPQPAPLTHDGAACCMLAPWAREGTDGTWRRPAQVCSRSPKLHVEGDDRDSGHMSIDASSMLCWHVSSHLTASCCSDGHLQSNRQRGVAPDAAFIRQVRPVQFVAMQAACTSWSVDSAQRGPAGSQMAGALCSAGQQNSLLPRQPA